MTGLPFALWEPQFRVFCIGLPKTGTTSIARIFRHYRSGHEVRFAETVSRLDDLQQGRVTRGEFRRLIVKGVTEGGYEMDSSSFNHYYLDILIREFPEARFILTLRDFESWVNSYLEMLLRWRRTFPSSHQVPKWQMAYGRCQFGTFDPDDFLSMERLKAKLPEIVGRFFACWSESYARIARLMDRARTLVLETHRISSALDAMGRFMGIPETSLDVNGSHSNRGTGEVAVTDFLEPGYIEQFTLPEGVEALFFLARSNLKPQIMRMARTTNHDDYDVAY